ncbi:MAG: ImmA/IrrE family metallo-endopeptidase [Solirubrobacterales bacterium]
MSQVAVSKAEAVAARHGRDPFRIARRLGYRVFFDPLPKGIEEMIVPDARMLFLRPECRRDRLGARRLVAHALGHHYLHEGAPVLDSIVPQGFYYRHERQAEAFAATLLFGRRAGEAMRG